VGRKVKWPRYVDGFLDRFGKPRFYLRRPGFKRVPFSAVFLSDDKADVDTAQLYRNERSVGAAIRRSGSAYSIRFLRQEVLPWPLDWACPSFMELSSSTMRYSR
jgi:hypothetical protein